MDPGRYDFDLYLGTDFERTFVWKDSLKQTVDLTGYTGRMQVKLDPDMDEDPILEFTTTGPNPTMVLGDDGTIVVSAKASVTEDFIFDVGHYDLILFPSGDAERAIKLLYGRVRAVKRVTS